MYYYCTILYPSYEYYYYTSSPVFNNTLIKYLLLRLYSVLRYTHSAKLSIVQIVQIMCEIWLILRIRRDGEYKIK